MIDIRQPNITAGSQGEQVMQMRSYLYQLSQQLQWAFNTISQGEASGNVGASLPRASEAAGSGGAVDAGATFSAIKGLIIKSSEIIDAYYDSMSSKMEGQYVAKSEFGEYQETTSNMIQGNSTNISQLFTNNRTILLNVEGLQGDTQALKGQMDKLGTDSAEVAGRVQKLGADTESLSGSIDQARAENAALSSTVKELMESTIQTNAYVRTGLLYERSDGVPVYGLEVGQTNNVNGENVFSKFARFSADRLSFYDRNDTEVAYISDYKLYINTAEITGALLFGSRFSVSYRAGVGLIFKWTGGNG